MLKMAEAEMGNSQENSDTIPTMQRINARLTVQAEIL